MLYPDEDGIPSSINPTALYIRDCKSLARNGFPESWANDPRCTISLTNVLKWTRRSIISRVYMPSAHKRTIFFVCETLKITNPIADNTTLTDLLNFFFFSLTNPSIRLKAISRINCDRRSNRTKGCQRHPTQDAWLACRARWRGSTACSCYFFCLSY